jgi:hypothetical protein
MEYKTKIKYGIFVINDAKYLKDGALKLELINDNIYQYSDSEEEAIERVKEGFEIHQGNYVVLPVYVKEKVEPKKYGW